MKISVVISVYNEEEIIDECLRSLQDQIRKADEIIIVDNNCTDASAVIARTYGARIIKERVQGIWAARATGYDAATGDIIVCTDADARFPADWLQQIEHAFLTDKTVIAVTGPGKFYGSHRMLNKIADVLYMQAYFFFVGAALGTKPLFGSNFAITKHAWQQVRGNVHSETEAVFDDIDLSYHIVGMGKIMYDPDISVHISIRPMKQPLGMCKRYIKGLRSVLIHWPAQAPWKLKA